MARMEQSDVSSQTGISVDTVKRLERAVGPVSANVATMAAVVKVLELGGVEFTNGAQPGVKMRLPNGFTDDELLIFLDQDHLWHVEGDLHPLPPKETKLRNALRRAHGLQTAWQKVTSIRNSTGRVVIPIEQIQRLWARFGAS